MSKSFAKDFEHNAKLQIDILNRANNTYSKDINELTKNQVYIGKKKQFKLMQPMALKPFANIIHKHLSKEVKPNANGKYIMFTLVTGYDFGKDNWNNNYQKLQQQTKNLLKDYNYVATVALDEFPKEKYLGDGTLMSWHVHGIIFEKPSRYKIKKINQQIKRKGHKIVPFKTSSFENLIDAVYYAFKAPFGGKVKIGKEKTSFRRVRLSLFSYYQNLTKLKDYPIYYGMFAGGKGRKILRDIMKEIKRVKS